MRRQRKKTVVAQLTVLALSLLCSAPEAQVVVRGDAGVGKGLALEKISIKHDDGICNLALGEKYIVWSEDHRTLAYLDRKTGRVDRIAVNDAVGVIASAGTKQSFYLGSEHHSENPQLFRLDFRPTPVLSAVARVPCCPISLAVSDSKVFGFSRNPDPMSGTFWVFDERSGRVSLIEDRVSLHGSVASLMGRAYALRPGVAVAVGSVVGASITELDARRGNKVLPIQGGSDLQAGRGFLLWQDGNQIVGYHPGTRVLRSWSTRQGICGHYPVGNGLLLQFCNAEQTPLEYLPLPDGPYGSSACRTSNSVIVDMGRFCGAAGDATEVYWLELGESRLTKVSARELQEHCTK